MTETVMTQDLVETKRRWLLHCGIPPRYMDVSFADIKQGLGEKNNILRIKKVCQDYAENFPVGSSRGYKSLLLFSAGENAWGNGKTHFVASIGHAVVANWLGKTATCPILFTSEPTLFRRIQATYNIPFEERGRHETEDDIMRELLGVPLLILDDLGKEERSDSRFVQRMLFAIINGRYEAELPMVLTANLSLEQLVWYLGGERSNEASFDRLQEMCGGEFFELVGESYRGQK